MSSDMKASARVRKIGNSLGVVIPSEEAKRSGIKEGDVVEIEIQRRVSFKELFGSAKFSKSTDELVKEAREGWGE